ncbi:MAG: T9SS type A sorting domain-containing protein [Bacteroidetes bacterium]|nr:T9SS type A sorting domain-containing protein [Bacteroidota bacterium]
MYGKLPISLILSCIITWFSVTSMYGQAPFVGGSSDGQSGVRLTNSTCVAITANPYAGGDGNTHFYDTLINSVCAPTLFTAFSGGVADGFAEGQLIVSVCTPSLLLPFSGGVADGFAQDNQMNSTCSSVIINPFSGGVADGFAEYALINSTCYSVIINPFSGGIADGFAYNTQVVSVCFPILITPFNGGIADGFSNDAFIQSVCYPELFSIFSGGDADGSAGALLAASLGFNVPPPASNPVCENSQALIGLAGGDTSLIYQWELSINGGTVFNSISNGAPYTGATEDTLWIDPVTNSFNGYVYRVLVSYPGCISGYSPNSTLVVGAQPSSPTIIKDPNVDYVCPGTDVAASFNAGTGGVGTIQDIYEYSTNAGTLWNSYTVSDPILTNSLQGIEIVKIRSWRSATGQGCLAADSSMASWTVAGEGYWIGVTSPDWNTNSNWGCGIIPDTTIDVTIPEVQLGNHQPNIYNTPPAFAHNLTIEPDASVTTFFGFNLELHGDFTNNGITSLGIGTVKFGGPTLQSIQGTIPTEFSYVEVANRSLSTALILNQDIDVSDEFKITQGMVNLNGHYIDLGTTGMLAGETETSRITGDSGQVRSLIDISQLSTAYNNIHGLGIDLTTGATAAPGLSEVNRGHHSYLVEPGSPAIERYFEIIPVVNANLDVTMKMHYFDAELASNSEPVLTPWRSEDQRATWTGQFFPSLLTRDANANWVQQTGINAFSDWTLSGPGSALPVELLEFTAWAEGEVVRLKWMTAIEINNDYFTVERSRDGVNFSDLFMVDGAGNSTAVLTYRETDKQPLSGVSYYRLRQTDFDGTTTHSQIVAVSFNSSYSQSFNAFVGENQNFNVSFQTNVNERLSLSVFDVAGRKVISQDANATKGNNMILVKNPGLAAAMYILEFIAGDFHESKKLFVK